MIKYLPTLILIFSTVFCYSQTIVPFNKDTTKHYRIAEPYRTTIWPPQIERCQSDQKAKVKLLYVPFDIYKATEKINEYCARDTCSCLSIDLNREPGSKFRTAIITYKRIEPYKITK